MTSCILPCWHVASPFIQDFSCSQGTTTRALPYSQSSPGALCLLTCRHQLAISRANHLPRGSPDLPHALFHQPRRPREIRSWRRQSWDRGSRAGWHRGPHRIRQIQSSASPLPSGSTHGGTCQQSANRPCQGISGRYWDGSFGVLCFLRDQLAYEMLQQPLIYSQLCILHKRVPNTHDCQGIAPW